MEVMPGEEGSGSKTMVMVGGEEIRQVLGSGGGQGRGMRPKARLEPDPEHTCLYSVDDSDHFVPTPTNHG